MKWVKFLMKKVLSILLSLSLAFSVAFQSAAVSAAESITIYYNDAELKETLHITEYNSAQLTAHSPTEFPSGTSVQWESNMPLLADVDDNGNVTAYDYSKAAVINLPSR